MALQNYVRLLINFKQSVVGNLHHFDKMEEALSRKENVILLANHQTEADPGDLGYKPCGSVGSLHCCISCHSPCH